MKQRKYISRSCYQLKWERNSLQLPWYTVMGKKNQTGSRKKYFLILNYMCLNISLPLFFYEQPCFLNLLQKLVIPMMLTEIRLMTCNSTHHQVQQVSHGSLCPLACRGSILSHASPGNFPYTQLVLSRVYIQENFSRDTFDTAAESGN